VPHMLLNGFKNIAAISLEADIKVKQLGAPSASAPAKSAPAPAKEEKKNEPKKEEKKEEPAEEALGDMFGD